MAGPFRDYMLGLSVLTLIMTGYQMTVARWLEPPPIDRAPIATRILSDHDESLVDLYPEDAWQRGRSIRLKTQDGMLLFQNWEQNKDDRDGGKKWRLWPITMVIGRGLDAHGDRQPIVIEADEGAVIEFGAALDVMSGVAPTIQRGQLMGAVTIRRINANQVDADNTHLNSHPNPDSAYEVQPDDQTLDIRTANVGIDRRKIWTTEAIRMQVGRAVMVGRDLTLHLATSTNGSPSRSSISRSLDRLELIYLRELTLPLDKQGDAPDDRNGVVQVNCDGRIEYDFALDQLLLDRNVRLVRTTQSDPSRSTATAPNSTSRSTPIDRSDADADQERFECESLRLTLRDPLNSKRTRATAMDWIDRIEATGNPVRLSMRSQGIDLVTGQLLFDPVEGWLVLEPTAAEPNPIQQDTSPRSNRSDPPVGVVQIRRGDLQADVARIVYRFDAKHPQQLGTIKIDGSGEVDYSAPGSVLQSFRWRDSLRVSPLDTATPDAMDVRFGVWCDGAIEALLSDGGSFVTDRIEGVLKPVDPSIAETGDRTGNPSPTPTKASVDHQWFPDRFSAIGNVRIQSANLNADTDQMNLFFEQKNLYPKQPGAAPADSSARTWVRQPDAVAVSDSNAEGFNRGSQPIQQPATIRGDQVTAKLTFGHRELTATDLSVVGNVKVTHAVSMKSTGGSPGSPTKPAEPMLAIMTGDHLRLRDGGGSGGGDVLQLGSRSGTPARLEMGDGYFIGPEIQVRPDDNYVWIPAAGEFLIPSVMLPSLGNLSGTGETSRFANDPPSSTRWSRSPHCRFGGSMTFDGSVASLGGGVEMRTTIVNNGQPSEIQMIGDELRFLLVSPVQLRNPSSFGTAQLQQVSLLSSGARPVEVRVDQFAGDGVRQSRHELAVQSLNWMPGSEWISEPQTPGPQTPGPQAPVPKALSGQIVAPGPGSYRGWIRGKLEPPTPSRASSDSSNDGNRFTASVSTPGMIEDAELNDKTQPDSFNDKTIVNGVHLVFQESMRGDLMAKSLTFIQGVRIAKKVVGDFNEVFEASEMDRLGVDELTLDCDQVRLSIDPSVPIRTPQFAVPGRSTSRPPALEVEASGGVVFRSRTEKGLSQATADRCGYAVAKDLVTITGRPGRPARFQQNDVTGQPVANAAIRTMTLRMKPFEILHSEVESFQTGSLPVPGSKR